MSNTDPATPKADRAAAPEAKAPAGSDTQQPGVAVPPGPETTRAATPESAEADAAYEAQLRADFKAHSRDELLADYREMLRIRRFEEAAARAYTRGKISGFLHLYIGQEAIAVATKQVMHAGDRVVSTYRTHGFALALGSDPNACAAELFGKATGLVGGIGGSMHFFDRERGLWGGYAIVGNHIPVAAGHAFASKYTGDGKVTLCFMGDGAVGIGPVHEGMTMAGILKLPIVFVVENNQYSMGTPLKRTLPVEDITSRAAGYGFDHDRFQVTSVHETRARLQAAVDRARERNQPTLIEMITYRFRGHSMSDPAKYRQKEEVERWRRTDPLERAQRALQVVFGVGEEQLDAIDNEIVAEMDAAYEFADRSPQPPPEARFHNIMVGE